MNEVSFIVAFTLVLLACSMFFFLFHIVPILKAMGKYAGMYARTSVIDDLMCENKRTLQASERLASEALDQRTKAEERAQQRENEAIEKYNQLVESAQVANQTLATNCAKEMESMNNQVRGVINQYNGGKPKVVRKKHVLAGLVPKEFKPLAELAEPFIEEILTPSTVDITPKPAKIQSVDELEV